MKKVLLTDYAWPDTAIEERVIGAAGFQLVCGPSAPSSPEEVARLVHEHNPAAILTCWARVDAHAIAAAKNLKIVARLGVGLDNIDVAEATRRRIVVTNVPDYCVEEVSDHVLAMVLAWTRGIVDLSSSVRRGQWEPGSARLRRLAEMTVGIVGFGRIGRRTAQKLKPWGCTVLVSDPAILSDAGITQVALDELLRESDVVVIHAPLTPATTNLFDMAKLESMRRGAFLVNPSRGGIVDTQALIRALQSGHLGGAGLDVLDSEPDVPQALRELPNVILTPHVAFSSDASVAELRRRACEEVVTVLQGNSARNPVNQFASD
ncbi:MAG: C-terminal binding protein [Pseudomonadota bacterium]